MEDSKNNGQRGFFSNVLGVAKKLSDVGLDVVQQVTDSEVQQIDPSISKTNVIDGVSRKKNVFEANKYENPKQILGTYLPQMSQNVFGRYYSKVDRVASFISPEFSEKVTDYVYEHINSLTNQISSVDSVLDQVGIQDLEELTQDIGRSQRIAKALAEQNKWIASVQGAISGVTGTIGAAVDIPLSMMLSLRTIYQVGRAHGFDLNKVEDQDIIQYVFKQVNLSLIAEKQALLMGLRTISQTIETHDIYQLQQLLGSSNDIQYLQKWLSNESGELKWNWLNKIPQLSKVTKLIPIANVTIGAFYNWKLIENVQQNAQTVFGQTRDYLIQHKDLKLSPMVAYEKSMDLLHTVPKKIEETLKTNKDEQNQVIQINSKTTEEFQADKNKKQRSSMRNAAKTELNIKESKNVRQVTETSQELKKSLQVKPVTNKSSKMNKR